MIKYFCKQSKRGIGKFNDETEEFDIIEYMNTGIDWAYVIPEDGDLTWTAKDGKSTTKPVKKYDVVLQLYASDSNKHDALIIRSKEWKENIKCREELAKKRAEDREKCVECGDCCDCCESSNVKVAA